MKEKTYRLVTLGCRTNQYESQAYADQLQEKGYRRAEEGETPDVCIVNTCTVTASADQRSRYQIRKLAREAAPEHLIVTGCLAERDPEGIGALPGVTHVVGNGDKEDLLPRVFADESWPEFSIRNFEARTRAFVKIQDGCNSYCSYCIIPMVRGRSRSRTLPDILREVEGLVEEGFREVVLTGINIGDFDGQENLTLADLMGEIDKIPGLCRLRLSSIDPDEVDEALLETILAGRTTCHSLHLVLQSGSNVILKKMRRKYSRQDFFSAVKKARAASPHFTFTTDVIVGFPGEEEADFRETCDVIDEVGFVKVHHFPYSDRPGTRASRWKNKVPQEVIKARSQRLATLCQSTSYRMRKEKVGQRLSVLIEGPANDRPDYLQGHSENFLPVIFPKGSLRPNTIVSVLCQENGEEALIGAVDAST
ncbi:MAG: tRNA (N(6)-L-threonylcarbamoyladenosine(37)-C(2))-methylthiotransferase MtaB [Chlamydiota bacterium]|nr:tRNA (N(6)-L-threonylcarbamoyladenosine(37)-C(2))-methylthiotransferase MtaB [Chlamydiota bacterium]